MAAYEMATVSETVVWQRSFALAMEILDIAEEGPISKRFYFRDQLCGAAMSIPSNIAEGNGRSTPLDYASFIDRAHGSLCELDTWILASVHKGWITAAIHERWAGEILELSPMLHSLARRLRSMNRLPSRP
jgi:four helix bundle protein